MRILFLSHCVPYPPNKGDRLRAFHSLRHLSRDHDVDLLALAREDEEVQAVSGLREYCRSVEVFRVSRRSAVLRSALGLLGRRPLTLAYFRSAPLERRVQAMARERRFDAVIAYCSSMAPYADLVEGVPKILDMVDVDSAKWDQYARFARFPKRLVYGIEGRRLRAYERDLARRFDRILLTTSREVECLRSFAPGAPAVVAGNGIDLDSFRPLPLPKSPVPLLMFTGQMDYFPNVDAVVSFARGAFPRLRRRFPELQLAIVGRAPTLAVTGLEKIPGITVTGAVGDVRPLLARAWVFVAPLRIAQGIQNKALEAMAMELPVVASRAVMQGLVDGGLKEGRDLLVASSEDEMERAVGMLLEDEEERQRIAVAGRHRVAGAFPWEKNREVLERVVSEVTGKGAPAPRGSSRSSPIERRAGDCEKNPILQLAGHHAGAGGAPTGTSHRREAGGA